MALASIAFYSGPEPCPVVIGRAGGNVGRIAVHDLDGRSDGAVARPHCPGPIPRAGCTGGMVVAVAAIFPRRFRLLGRMTWDGRSPFETIAVRLISPPAKACSSRSLRFK